MADRHIKVQLKDPEPNETSNFRQRIYYYDYWYPVTKADYVEGLRNGSKWFDGTSIIASTSPIPEGLDVSIGDYYLNSNTWNIWECVSLDDTETTDRWLLVGNIKGQDGNSINIKGSVTSPSNLPTDPQPEIGDCYVINGSSTPAENGHLWVYTGTTISDSTHVNGYEDLGSLQGPAGEDGATWNSGTYVGNSSHTTPFTSTTLTESDVKSGDYYLNSTTYDVYKCTAATNSNSSWSLVCNIKGAKGNTGSTGATGNGISSIAGPATSGLHDTYTINFTNGNSTTFTVTNGADGVSIGSISRTSGTGAAGTTDTYTVYDTDGNSIGTFNVYNGADGTAVGDSWRAIQVGGTQILGTGTNTGPLNLSAGPHTIVSQDANNVGKVVIQANYITTLNGTGYPTADNNNSLGSWYAPTTVGTSGYLLKSSGNGAPTWDSVFNILGATGQNGKYLQATSTGLTWDTPSGGTVTGVTINSNSVVDTTDNVAKIQLKTINNNTIHGATTNINIPAITAINSFTGGYDIVYTNYTSQTPSTTTYTITDGVGINSITFTSSSAGSGEPAGVAGATDTYTIELTDGSTSTFVVYNGTNGSSGTDKYHTPFTPGGASSGNIMIASGVGVGSLTVPWANASVAGVSKVKEVDDTLSSKTYKGEYWVEVVMDKTGKLFVPIDF